MLYGSGFERRDAYRVRIAGELGSRPGSGLISGLLGTLFLKVGISLTTPGTTLYADGPELRCKVKCR